MLKSAATVCCLLSLTACNNLTGQRAALQANTKYGNMAKDALEHLRESFNSGNCDLIYMEASDVFRKLESRDDWLRTCAQLRKRLGSWGSFSVGSTDVTPSFMAHMDGMAAFSSGGSCRLRFAWSLENGAARLFSLSLEGAGQQVVIPESSRPGPPRLIDPPAKPALEPHSARS
jgi:hypothetical protein